MEEDPELPLPLSHVRPRRGSSPDHVGALSLGSRPPGRGYKCLLWTRPLLGVGGQQPQWSRTAVLSRGAASSMKPKVLRWMFTNRFLHPGTTFRGETPGLVLSRMVLPAEWTEGTTLTI